MYYGSFRGRFTPDQFKSNQCLSLMTQGKHQSKTLYFYSTNNNLKTKAVICGIRLDNITIIDTVFSNLQPQKMII